MPKHHLATGAPLHMFGSMVPLAIMLALAGTLTCPDSVDVARIAEAYRLVDAVQDSVWPGGWRNTPMPVLLITSEREFLIGDQRNPTGFSDAACSTRLQRRILARPRQFAPDLLATFPAFGPPSLIVVGRAEATGKNSTTWALTLLHEHFHQFQNGDTSYFAAVEQLDLSGGDKSGMWMLNYPFPYDSVAVARQYATLSRQLRGLLERSTPSARRAFWRSYEVFLAKLSERDRRYLSFQIWQEGIARYVELRAAEAAARLYKPAHEFEALPDFQSFASVAAQMRAAILAELADPKLPERKRVSFYAFGAGLGLLLDKDAPDWKKRYLSRKFFLER